MNKETTGSAWKSRRLLAALAVLAVAFVVLAAVPAVATDSDAADANDSGHALGETGITAYFSSNGDNNGVAKYTTVTYSDGVYSVVGPIGALGNNSSSTKVYDGSAEKTAADLGYGKDAALDGVMALDLSKAVLTINEKKTTLSELTTGTLKITVIGTGEAYLTDLTRDNGGTRTTTSGVCTNIQYLDASQNYTKYVLVPSDASTTSVKVEYSATAYSAAGASKATGFVTVFDADFDFSKMSVVVDLTENLSGIVGKGTVSYTSADGTLELKDYTGNNVFQSAKTLKVVVDGKVTINAYGIEQVKNKNYLGAALGSNGSLTITGAKDSAAELTINTYDCFIGIAGGDLGSSAKLKITIGAESADYKSLKVTVGDDVDRAIQAASGGNTNETDIFKVSSELMD